MSSYCRNFHDHEIWDLEVLTNSQLTKNKIDNTESSFDREI